MSQPVDDQIMKSSTSFCGSTHTQSPIAVVGAELEGVLLSEGEVEGLSPAGANAPGARDRGSAISLETSSAICFGVSSASRKAFFSADRVDRAFESAASERAIVVVL
jgi:hypothetical protein